MLGEALRVWTHSQNLRLSKATIVHAPDDEIGASLSTLLARKGIPCRTMLSTNAEGAALVEGPLADLALPAVQLWDGRVLGVPTTSHLASGGIRSGRRCLAACGNQAPVRSQGHLRLHGQRPRLAAA